MKRPPEVERFIRERDAMLLKLNVQSAHEFHARYNRESRFSGLSDDAVLASIHKARTGARTLPEPARRASIEWLSARGMRHYADDLA